MPIKEKSVFKKHEYEYESPDGDKYSVTYVEHLEREYVEIARMNADGSVTDKVVWDVNMFKDIADTLLKIKYGNSQLQYPPGVRGLTVPSITDHRPGRADIIEKSVNESMRKFDNSVAPVESFDPEQERQAWQKNAAGIDPSVATEEADETPEDIAIQGKSEAELSTWQKDALVRQTRGVTKDPSKMIRRIDAGDLM